MGLICSYIGNGVDEFEGDIMMTAEQWEEMKRDFKRTGQPVPIKQSPQNRQINNADFMYSQSHASL